LKIVFFAFVNALRAADPFPPSLATSLISLDKNGKIERNEIRLVASEGGNGSAARSAFTNAKKTIFKCQKKWDGFNLQDFDYEQWQQIVLTFNPDQMRNR
jgi:hypothetical protein